MEMRLSLSVNSYTALSEIISVKIQKVKILRSLIKSDIIFQKRSKQEILLGFKDQFEMSF